MGFHTVVIGRGKDKEKLARDLGAHVYIDSAAQDPAAALMALGGAKVILATATSGKSMTPLIGGLGVDGTMIVVGASPEPIEVNSYQVIGDRRGRSDLASFHVGAPGDQPVRHVQVELVVGPAKYPAHRHAGFVHPYAAAR